LRKRGSLASTTCPDARHVKRGSERPDRGASRGGGGRSHVARLAGIGCSGVVVGVHQETLHPFAQPGVRPARLEYEGMAVLFRTLQRLVEEITDTPELV
jgi:hypothetical protein